MYKNGDGLKKDPVKAYTWAGVAAACFPDSPKRKRVIRNRDRAARTLTAEQKKKAEALAAELKAKVEKSD